MTGEPFYQWHLDRYDIAAMLLFGEWLEESGDNMAETYKWMARTNRFFRIAYLLEHS